MRKLVLSLSLLLLLVLAACGAAQPVAEQPSATATARSSATARPSATATIVPRATSTAMPTAIPVPTSTARPPAPVPTATPVPALLPTDMSVAPPADAPADLVERARQALASHTGVDVGSFTLVASMPQEWRDGSLGCPDPSLGYTQAIVPGYLLLFSDGTREYSIHTSVSGRPLILCRDGMPEMLEP